MPIALLIALLCTFAAEDPRLLPGQRLEGVTRAVLVLEQPGAVTLARSNGTLRAAGRVAESGWLVLDLPAGEHVVELPGGTGDVTALAGAVEVAAAGDFLNRGVAALNSGDLGVARTALLACRARPGAQGLLDAARVFQGLLVQREGGDLDQAYALLRDLGQAASVVANIGFYADSGLAEIALELGEWDESAAAFTRLREAAGDAGARAAALGGLARVAAARGRHDEARTLHAQALAEAEAHGEPWYVSNLAFLAGRYHQSRADFARAAELLQQAADAAPTWFLKVAAQGQLAVVELVRGHYGRAQGLLDAAQELAAPHSPSPHDEPLLVNRAAVAYALGEFGVAREALETLLERGGTPEQVAHWRANLGLLAFMGDEPVEAERHYDQALGGAPPRGRARWLALNGKAALLCDQQRYADAARLATEALELAGVLDDPYFATVSQLAVGEADLRLGRPQSALERAAAALASLQRQDAGDLILPALHGMALAELALGHEERVAELLARAWEEAGRPEVSALDPLDAAQVRSRLGELADWSAVAADLAARRAARDPDSVAAGLREVSRWKARTLQQALGREAPDAGDLLAGLRAALGERALVEYAAGDERLYAFVLEGDAPRLVDLGERRGVERTVQAFVAGLADTEAPAGLPEVVRLGGELHARLLAPLGLRRDALVVVPDGELARLPFEALVMAAPPGAQRFAQVEFVLDRFDLGYAPSSAALVALAQRPPPAARRALLVGDPTYVPEAAPSLLAARGPAARAWPRLPRSRDEVTRVARLLLTGQDGVSAGEGLLELARAEDTRDVSLSTGAFDLRLGRRAGAAALRELAPQAGLIHLATHAFADRHDPRRSGLMLAWDEVDQGFLGLADIAELRLDAELVVLSACNTADGRLLNGEGVQSLASAFLAAGAHGVVATLWAVRDTQAQDVMDQFSAARWREGQTAEQALRTARRRLRGAGAQRGGPTTSEAPDAEFGHPQTWAAYLYTGAPGG